MWTILWFQTGPLYLYMTLMYKRLQEYYMFMFYQRYPCVKRSTISNLDTSGKKIEAILTTERNVISTISFSPCWTSYKLECTGRRHINCNKEKNGFTTFYEQYTFFVYVARACPFLRKEIKSSLNNCLFFNSNTLFYLQFYIC